MKASLRNGFRSGIIFGIVIIFFVLIGFNITAAILLGKLLGNVQKGTMSVAQSGEWTPAMSNLLIFFGLIGLWAGSSGSKSTGKDTWGGALSGALASGITSGLLVGLFTLAVGLIYTHGIDMRRYLAAVTPESMGQFLLGVAPLRAALIHLGWLIATALLGGIVARGIARGEWRRQLVTRWNNSALVSNNRTTLKRIQQYPVIRYVISGLVVFLVLLLPLKAGQYWNYTLGTVGIYVLLGLGLNVVVGLAGLLDLGYVAFFAIGAYTVALLTAPEPHHLQWSFWVALPIGIALAAIAGVLLGIPVLRMRGDYLAIVTLGFGEIIRNMSRSDVLTPLTAGPRGVRNIAGPTLFGKPFNDNTAFLYLIILACLLVIFVTLRLQNSRVGRAWIAMREDEIVARAMGINTLSYKLLAFGIGAAFAGLGGVIFASRNQFTGPDDHVLMVSINVLCLVIVGGMGSIPGVIVGALVLKGLPEVLRELDIYRILAFGALLVVMMILRPEGLWPSARQRLEVHQSEEPPIPQVIEPSFQEGDGS